MDYINIGPCPLDEECVPVSRGAAAMQAECLRYIEKLRDWFGPEPANARLAVKGFPHDFGTYYEVVCWYHEGDEAAMDYACACESDGPGRWEEVRNVPASGV